MKDFWAFPGPETILGIETKRFGGTDLTDVGGRGACEGPSLSFQRILVFFFFSFNNPHRSPFVCTAHFCFLLTSPSSARLYPGRRKQAFPQRGALGWWEGWATAAQWPGRTCARQVKSHRVDSGSAGTVCLMKLWPFL